MSLKQQFLEMNLYLKAGLLAMATYVIGRSIQGQLPFNNYLSGALAALAVIPIAIILWGRIKKTHEAYHAKQDAELNAMRAKLED